MRVLCSLPVCYDSSVTKQQVGMLQVFDSIPGQDRPSLFIFYLSSSWVTFFE